MKLLILYEELADYFLSCVKELVSGYGVEVHLVRKKVNAEAPFAFDTEGLVEIYERSDTDHGKLKDLAARIGPDAILCCGWSNKTYLDISRTFRQKIPVILGFDNKWEGTVRQRLLSVLAKRYFRSHFSACFVPGKKQVEFAQKLGFGPGTVSTGIYSCDYSRFKKIGEGIPGRDTQDRPPRFIYSGRYYEFKGVLELWRAFAELKEEVENDWELWCIGTGSVTPVDHPAIRHFGFVQPPDLEKYLMGSDVFVMPSRVEPWGVALHEFTAAGFPVICSDQVGAAECFLDEARNGYSFPAGNKDALKQAMKKMMLLDRSRRKEMGRVSAELASAITPSTWAKTVLKLIQETNVRH